MSKTVMTFFVALLYGVCLIAGPLNLIAAILALANGGDPRSFAAMIVATFGIIVFVHSRLRLFPFHGKGNKPSPS